MATWVALFLARPRGTARAASTSLPFAGVSSRSLSSPEVVVVLQFCLNLFGSASGEHPRSGMRRKSGVCVFQAASDGLRATFRIRGQPVQNVLVSTCASSSLGSRARCLGKSLKCIRQPAT